MDKRPSVSTLIPSQWLSYDKVQHADGIGYVTTGQRRLSDGSLQLLFDLDACVDPQTGDIAEWAQKFVRLCHHSWTEISPSGTGLHVGVNVRNIEPKKLRSLLVNHAAAMPNTNGKRAGIQLFGLGPAGYMCISGNHLDGTAEEILTLDNIDKLVHAFGLDAGSRVGDDTPELPEGQGPSPATEAVKAAIWRMPYGPELLTGRWKEIKPEPPSASDAFFLLCQMALRAASGHGKVAVQVLLESAWGQGLIEDSKDPGKYTREEWVEKDVARVGAKAHHAAIDVRTVFEASPLPEPSSNGDVRPANPYRIVWPWQLAARPQPEDLWARIIVQGSLNVWYGAPACGKSTLALGLGIAIAEGAPFLGRRTSGGLVLYIAGEGVGGLPRKLAGYTGMQRVESKKDTVNSRFGIIEKMPPLTQRSVFDQVCAAIEELPEVPALVIVDTVARGLGAGGLDENSTGDMGLFVAALDALRIKYRCAVLGVHHAGKNGTDRGSSALPAACDTVCRIERGNNDRESKVIIEKQRDGEPVEPIIVTFGRRPVAIDENGQVWRWFVLQSRDEKKIADRPLDKKEVLRRKHVMDVLAENGALSGDDIARKIGGIKSTVWDCLQRMVADGLLGRVTTKKPYLYDVCPDVRPSSGRNPDQNGPSCPDPGALEGPDPDPDKAKTGSEENNLDLS